MENWRTFHHYFFLTHHSQKYFTKAFYYLLLLVTTHCWLIIPKSTLWKRSIIKQKRGFPWSNVTYHSQKCILSVFYYVEFPLGKWVNKRIKSTQKQKAFCETCCKLKRHSVYIKLGLTLQSSTTLKIGELLLTANSPNLSDVTIWRVTVNG